MILWCMLNKSLIIPYVFQFHYFIQFSHQVTKNMFLLMYVFHEFCLNIGLIIPDLLPSPFHNSVSLFYPVS